MDKICNRCGESKPISEYSSRPKGKDGLRAQCRECCSRYGKKWKDSNKEKVIAAQIHRKYNLSIEELQQLIKNQEGLCSICKRNPELDGIGRWNKLVVDHDHITGQVRSMLCQSCNSGLGHFKDNLTLLQKAVNYLREHGER